MCDFTGDKFLKPKTKTNFHRWRPTLYYYCQEVHQRIHFVSKMYWVWTWSLLELCTSKQIILQPKNRTLGFVFYRQKKNRKAKRTTFAYITDWRYNNFSKKYPSDSSSRLARGIRRGSYPFISCSRHSTIFFCKRLHPSPVKLWLFGSVTFWVRLLHGGRRHHGKWT